MLTFASKSVMIMFILSQTQGPYHKGNGITQEHEMDHSGLQSWCQLIIVV